MKKLLLAALTAGVLRGTVCAHERAIWGLDDNVSIGYRLTDFYYVEPSNTCALAVCANALQSPYLDREFGFISGLHASASGLLFDDRVYTRLAYDRVSGHVRYQGYSQSGAAIPDGVSGAMISGYGIRLGATFPDGPVMAVPFLEYGHHAWRRLIGVGTAQAYEEDYHHDYVALGALIQVALTRTLVGSIYAAAGRTLNPSIAVASLGFSQGLGTSALIKAGASLDLWLSHRLGLYAAVRYTRFSYGQSAPQESGNLVIMEPQSNTVMADYEGGLRFVF
ncbi:hypothetical protein [Acidiferrobacter sp.]|uniref:hypothetical protein n=1 Tax=Acidiferrobacter sp. TaxID=1872107 RepID=UPI002627F07D|nr:hypothetical protein [Acidiferrobacter sp.]